MTLQQQSHRFEVLDRFDQRYPWLSRFCSERELSVHALRDGGAHIFALDGPGEITLSEAELLFEEAALEQEAVELNLPPMGAVTTGGWALSAH